MKRTNYYTLSIEEALTPFIRQVESLINLRQINSFRPLSQYSLCKACENVNVAVLGFIATADNIASNYPQVSTEIRSACNWSRSLVTKILDNTLYNGQSVSSSNQQKPVPDAKFQTFNTKSQAMPNDKNQAFHSLDNKSNSQHSNATFGQFAEGLMTGIERILLLADWLVVLDVRRSIVKVIQSLSDLDSRGTENFPNFMHMFSRFGADMVELGELSGQRQMDLKNSQLRCLVALVRSMLERTTMMILAVWKINFRHDTRLSRSLRSLTFQHTNYLLDLLMAFLVVSHPLYNEMSKGFRNMSQELINKDVTDKTPGATGVGGTNQEDLEFLEKESQNLYEKIISSAQQIFMWELLKKLKNLVTKSIKDTEMEDYDEYETQSKNDAAVSLVSDLLNSGQYFTQCSFVTLAERQHVISLCRRLRVQLRSCFETSKEAVDSNNKPTSDDRGSQARLFVEDLCDQILAAIFNITMKYGDEIISVCLNISENIDLSNLHNMKKSIQTNPSNTNGTNTNNDDRKPPRPGVSTTSRTTNDNNSITKQLDSDLTTADEQQRETTNSSMDTTIAVADSRHIQMSSINIGIMKVKMITFCNFLAQVSMSKEISLVCLLTRDFIETLTQMIGLSTQIFQEISTSKHAKDCTDVLLDIWTTVINDVANIKADIVEWRNNRYAADFYPTYPGSYATNEPLPPANSDSIMRNYRLLHNTFTPTKNPLHRLQYSYSPAPNTTLSAPASPSATLLSNRTQASLPFPNSIQQLQQRFNQMTASQSPSRLQQFNYPPNTPNAVSSTFSNSSINSLEKEKYSMASETYFPGLISESPNPWLSVSEIERIITMKGRVVIDLASQITMFSHNEGPLKTSSDLMSTVQQLIREMANFHGFAERNIVNDRMLPDLDRFPSLISCIYSVHNMPVKSRGEIFAKIDKLVELVRFTATLVTNVMTSWRSQSVVSVLPKPLRSKSFNSRNQVSTPPISGSKTRFVFDEIPDNKSCFSDTVLGGSIYPNKHFNGPRSASLGRPDV